MKNVKFNELVKLVALLRSENGCPWDKEQTHESLLPSIEEEVQEVAEAINAGDKENLKEELGDVLLNILLQAQIAAESNDFDIDDVLETVSEKVVRRHPHVFGDKKLKNSGEVLEEWARIKKTEKNKNKKHKN